MALSPRHLLGKEYLMRPSNARLAGPLWLAAGSLIALTLTLFAAGLLSARPAHAQGLGLEITKTLRGSAEVQIGQILEFTIRITNTGALPLTDLDLVDEFVGSIVAPVGSGPYAKPGDPPLSDTTPFSYDGSQTITWSLLGGGKTLPTGGSLAVLVRLRAVHPTADLQTVNRARIARAIRSDGGSAGGGDASVPARPDGARLPMSKSMGAPAPVAAGLPITFTIIITNESLIDIVSLPLRDVYNPSALRFESANPPPDSVDQVGGVLAWSDLLSTTGRAALRPGESIRIQTVYTALRDITDAVNTAEVSGAKDEYGNAVSPRQAQVPIRIVGPSETPGPSGPLPTDAPLPTRTPFATAGPRLTEIAGRTATAAAQTAPTATPTDTAQAAPTAVATTPVMPTSLPNTGESGPSPLLWLIMGLALLGAALALRR
jgi:LPXTG-motif cell wall-anchored protein